MKVRKIWRTQFIWCCFLLVAALLSGGTLVAYEMFREGMVILLGGVVIGALGAGLLLWKFRCPNCRGSLYRRLFESGTPSPKKLRCPHCDAVMPLE